MRILLLLMIITCFSCNTRQHHLDEMKQVLLSNEKEFNGIIDSLQSIIHQQKATLEFYEFKVSENSTVLGTTIHNYDISQFLKTKGFSSINIDYRGPCGGDTSHNFQRFNFITDGNVSLNYYHCAEAAPKLEGGKFENTRVIIHQVTEHWNVSYEF